VEGNAETIKLIGTAANGKHRNIQLLVVLGLSSFLENFIPVSGVICVTMFKRACPL
jgi:hypothetical protein